MRQRLHSLGINIGYQWCAGSFCEDIERLESRNPRDIDVVTFFMRPPHLQGASDWLAFVEANRSVFDAQQTKENYQCDAYFVDASTFMPRVIDQVTYWHGLFGHRRTSHMWKGMLRLPLVSDDADALVHLDRVWP